jgi:hypothetical protein
VRFVDQGVENGLSCHSAHSFYVPWIDEGGVGPKKVALTKMKNNALS